MLNEIMTRQSIRKYLDKSVEEEKIMGLLEAAMNAPTARNTQSWRFIVVRNREALNDMHTLQPYTQMMKEAPCAILVLGDTRLVENQEYLYCDSSAAIENMLIEAKHLGLDTCWCAIGPKQERIDNFRNYYHIEDHLLPIAAVAIGYGNEHKPIINRFDSSKITYFD